MGVAGFTACGADSRRSEFDPGPFSEYGAVAVEAGLNYVTQEAIDCPGITNFSVNPIVLSPGQSAQLTLTTTGPAPLVTWIVSPAGGGTFDLDVDPTSPTFQCAATNTQVTVTAIVSLADSGACATASPDGAPLPFTTMAARIRCE